MRACLVAALALAAVACSESLPAQTAPARPRDTASVSDVTSVSIDAAKPLGRINALAFGMHLEWSEAGNGLLDRKTGVPRREVLDALGPLRLPLFRFPGGIHADYYDWSAGIAPRGRRADAVNVFTKRPEKQLFGTPEFVELLRALNGDALITANYGTGTPEMAAAWAKYFKDAGVSVPYWEVGNETYLADPDKDQPNGRRIAKTGQQYAADFPRFRDAIRSVMPDARVGAIAHVDNGAFPLAPPSRRDWSSRMLSALSASPDFVSVHTGYAPVIIDDSVRFDDAAARARVYRALYAAPRQTLEDLDEVQQMLDRNDRTRGKPIAITEWGALFGYSSRPDIHAAYVDQSRTMAAAVYVASFLDLIVAHPRVLLATYTNPIHQWYGGLLTDTDRGLIKTPTYYVFSMYRSRFESRALPVTVNGSTFDAPSVGLVKAQRGVPEVLARASVSDDGRRLSIMMVNRSLDRAARTRVALSGFPPGRTDCLVLSASAPNALSGQGLTKTTVSNESIVPRPMACEVSDAIALSIPPSGVISVVVERR